MRELSEALLGEMVRRREGGRGGKSLFGRSSACTLMRVYRAGTVTGEVGSRLVTPHHHCSCQTLQEPGGEGKKELFSEEETCLSTCRVCRGLLSTWAAAAGRELAGGGGGQPKLADAPLPTAPATLPPSTAPVGTILTSVFCGSGVPK